MLISSRVDIIESAKLFHAAPVPIVTYIQNFQYMEINLCDCSEWLALMVSQKDEMMILLLKDLISTSNRDTLPLKLKHSVWSTGVELFLGSKVLFAITIFTLLPYSSPLLPGEQISK